MDFSKWWTKARNGSTNFTQDITTRLNNISLPGNCLQGPKSCLLTCGRTNFEVSIRACESSPNEEVFESRSKRTVMPGLREDEAAFACGIQEEAISNLSPAAAEDELHTPAEIGPPCMESPRGQSMTESSDIESARTSEDADLSVHDSCSAMHLLQSSVWRKAESTQTTFRHSTNFSDGWIKSSVLATAQPTYRCLGEPNPPRTPLCVKTMAELLERLRKLDSEASVSLQVLSYLRDEFTVTKDMSAGDIIYIGKGVAGVGRDQSCVSTVVVSAQNSSQNSQVRKTREFVEKSVPADCRLWELLYPLSPPSNRTPQKPRRCWGVWEFKTDYAQVSKPDKRNSVACYLNNYLIIFALQTMLRNQDRVRLYERSSVEDLQKLISGPVETKTKLSHFPLPAEAVCATVTTSASEELSPEVHRYTAEEVTELQLKVDSIDMERLAVALKTWPKFTAIAAVWAVYDIFQKLTDVGTTGGPAMDPFLNPLLYKMIDPIDLCRPKVQELIEAPSVQIFAEKHNALTVTGYLTPLQRLAPAIHRLVLNLQQRTQAETPQRSH